jgi:cytochrome c-type biogenesis protein CcmH
MMIARFCRHRVDDCRRRADDTMPPAPWAYRQLPDPAQEAKAKALMETLRCLVCQSQSIADSDASIAGDMRSQVRERIAAGEDPEAIALG